jgi:4-hydroxybenzoate polyprenyltransferase
MKITNSIFVVFLTTVVCGFAPKVLFVRDTKRKNFEMIDAFLEMENNVNPKWLIHNIDHSSFTPLNISNAEPASSYSRISTPTESRNSNLIVANMHHEVYFASSIMKIGNSMRKKAPHFARLVRSKNILPTLWISMVGGWITCPSLVLFRNPRFYATIAITQLIMANSMILNDLFDLKTDRINNPHRPLVAGHISKREAVVATVLLFIASEWINFTVFPAQIRTITHIANAILLLYTPILKRIIFLKNLSCAALVSTGLYFSGISVYPSISVMDARKTGLLQLATRLLFLGSLYIEILLDIRDKTGDKQNGVYTIPVLFGNDVSFYITRFILHFNILLHTLYITQFGPLRAGIYFFLICSPLLHDFRMLQQVGATTSNIEFVVNKTTAPMALALLYICLLAG